MLDRIRPCACRPGEGPAAGSWWPVAEMVVVVVVVSVSVMICCSRRSGVSSSCRRIEGIIVWVKSPGEGAAKLGEWTGEAGSRGWV